MLRPPRLPDPGGKVYKGSRIEALILLVLLLLIPLFILL